MGLQFNELLKAIVLVSHNSVFLISDGMPFTARSLA